MSNLVSLGNNNICGNTSNVNSVPIFLANNNNVNNNLANSENYSLNNHLMQQQHIQNTNINQYPSIMQQQTHHQHMQQANTNANFDFDFLNLNDGLDKK